MKPTRDVEGTIVELVDTILNKGAVISADIIISVAGIPLIGVNLRAAIAGMETMLRYGMMVDWDEQVRGEYMGEMACFGPPLLEGEEVVLCTLGSHYYSKGIYNAWRLGDIYVTDRRLLMFNRATAEVLFETPRGGITGMATKENTLHLAMGSGDTAMLKTANIHGLRTALETGVTGMHPHLENVALPREEPRFLDGGEEILQTAKVWYHAPASGPMGETWRPGHIHITRHRLCWCYDGDEVLFETPISGLRDVLLAGREMVLSYRAGQGEGRASFSGEIEDLKRLERAIRKEAVPA